MVKKFKRSAAGIEEQLPSDLRPPPVLRRTCDYLFDDMIGNARSLANVHHFVWDRTRAIRNDLSIQQVQKREDLRIAVECYERIARFHIMSLHQLALPEKPYSKYDWHQEREQLDRTLLSLMQFYDDSRGRIEFPNEAEFRAYCVILQLQDPIPDLEDRIQCWPRHIIQDSRVLKALDLYMAACNIMDPQGPLKPRTNHLIARQDWQRFWTLVASKEVSYLMACAAEVYFNLVRRTVLNALFCTSRQRGDKAEKDKKTTEWTIDVLCELLAFDNGDDVYTYCERFGFSFNEREDGQHYLDLSSVGDRTLPEPKAGMPKQLKSNLVEGKRFGRTLPAIINGMTVKRAQDAGMVMEQDEEDEIDMEDIGDLESEQQGMTNGIGSSDTFDDGDSLFLPETRKRSMFQSQTPASLASGARETTGGPSSTFSGLGTGFNLGKPSPFGDNTGAKSQIPGSSGLKFDFLNPTEGNAITGTESSSFSEMSPTTTTDTAADTKPAPSRLVEPSGISESIFSKPAALPPPTTQPMFPFSEASPTKSTSLDEKLSPKSNPSPLFIAPASAATNHETSQSQPTNHFIFDQPTGTPAALIPKQPSRSPETNSSQPHFTAAPSAPTSTLIPHPSTPGLGSGTRKLSSSRDHRPEKPSPLSHSFTAGDDSSAITDSHPGESFTAKPPPQGLFSIRQSQVAGIGAVNPDDRSISSPDPTGNDFDAIVARIAEEFYTDPIRGLLKLYIDHNVRQTIRDVQGQVENERLAEVANQYNRFRLHKKYGKRWRDLFWQKRLAKSGRERRERRQRRLLQRSSQEIDGGSLFDANTSGGHSQAGSVAGAENFGVRQSVEIDMYGRPMIGQQASQAMDTFHQVHDGAKRPTSSHGPEDVNQARQHAHKRMKSTSHIDERGRITKPSSTSHPSSDLLKRSSFLGFSPPHNGSNNKNTTKSNYFKLKALGVHRVDESIAPRGIKRRLSASGQESTQTSPPALRSPSLFPSNYAKPNDRTLMPPPSSTPARTPRINHDDEELFARLKAARENLMDSTTFYKSEVGKDDELRRSLNSSHSSNEFESPSMARARLEARMRASRGPSESGASSNRRDVPAYRLRESKFVPRESYGRAVERAKKIRESRSRETSRPESPQNHITTQREKAAATAGPTFGVQSKAPDQSSFTMASTKGPNGFSHKQDEQTGLPTFGPTSTSTSFAPQAPVSFYNHTTEMSSENPFLKAPVGNKFTGFNPEQASTFEGKQQHDSGPQDYTIRPSQINQALSNSFGSSHGYGANQLLSVPQDMNTPPQQDSYLQSQTISLLSEDEDDAPPSMQHPQVDSIGDTEATEELFSESSDEYESAQTNGHSNTYALLARQEYHDEDQQSFDSKMDDEDGYDEEDARPPNGYADSEEEDEEAIDGDIDDDDTEDIGDEGDAYGSEYDEEDEDMEHGQWRQQEYDQSWTAQPSKSSALEGVGNTAEEAIELSD
jgi:hypothetical protein